MEHLSVVKILLEKGTDEEKREYIGALAETGKKVEVHGHVAAVRHIERKVREELDLGKKEKHLE